MYPIVSITTSFVAEEDIMDKSSIEAEKVEGKRLENLEEASPKNVEMKEGKKLENLEEASLKNVEMKEPSPKNGPLSPSV